MPTIVVIEDETILANLVASELVKKDFTVKTADNGLDGWDLIEKELPALILLDLLMPGMSGYDVLKKLRSTVETKHIPCIVISNSGQVDDLNKAYTMGASDVLIKANFNPDQVVQKVQDLLHKEKEGHSLPHEGKE